MGSPGQGHLLSYLQPPCDICPQALVRAALGHTAPAQGEERKQGIQLPLASEAAALLGLCQPHFAHREVGKMAVEGGHLSLPMPLPPFLPLRSVFLSPHFCAGLGVALL